VLAVVTGEGERDVETDAVGAGAWTTGVLELVCVLGVVEVVLVVVVFLVEGWAGGRLSVYWSATGTPAGEVALGVEVVGVVVVVVVVAVGVVGVDVVGVDVVGVESAVALVAGRTNPIAVRRTPRASSPPRDRWR
jgi:hypothetical protein